MQRISVYISDETKQKITLAAKHKRKVEAVLIREAIEAGLKIISPEATSAENLLKLVTLAQQLPHKDGPTDVSEHVDYYAWGGEKNHE